MMKENLCKVQEREENLQDLMDRTGKLLHCNDSADACVCMRDAIIIYGINFNDSVDYNNVIE